MSSPGYRIFGDAFRRSEVAADKVEMRFAGSGYDHTAAVEAGKRSHIRGDFPHSVGALEHRQIVKDVGEDVDRRNSKSLRQTGRRWDPFRRSCRKLHAVGGSFAMDVERSTGRVEHDRGAAWFKPLHHHRGAGQRGAAAK